MKKILFILIFLLLVFGFFVLKNIFFPSAKPGRIGGDKDPHGCLIGAGYSWCPVKNKCLRLWEEGCGKTAVKASKENLPDNQFSCESRQGKWGPIGLGIKNECNLPTSDAGKACGDQSECEGACLAALSKEEKDRAMRQKVTIETRGQCTPWLITVGCMAQVRDEKVTGLLCAD
jgi:hypothetical protein